MHVNLQCTYDGQNKTRASQHKVQPTAIEKSTAYREKRGMELTTEHQSINHEQYYLPHES